MSSRLNLTRQQLAKFLPNHDAIKAFEELFAIAGQFSVTTIAELTKLIEEANIDAGTAEAKARKQNFLNGDYINFNLNGPHNGQVGQVSWNKDDDTLNIHHSDDVTQQVGAETYARVVNNTGAVLPNGTCVGFAGVFSPTAVEGGKYIADGSMTSIYILGIATQDIVDTGFGRVTTWGYVRGFDTTGAVYGETWALGDILYASAAIAGALTNIKPTAPLLVIPMAIVTEVHATDGSVFVRTTVDQPLYYGTFADTSDQMPAAINTAYPITFNTTQQSDGFYVGTPTSRIYAENTGFYSFKFSAQVTSSNANTKNLWFWARVNGVDLPNSSMKMSISQNGFTAPISRAVGLSMNAGEYLEAMWASDDVAVTLQAVPATTFAPATPSVILAINEITQ